MEKITLTMVQLAEAIAAGRTFAMPNGAPVPAPQFDPLTGWTWACDKLAIQGHADTLLTVSEYQGEAERQDIAGRYNRDIAQLLARRAGVTV